MLYGFYFILYDYIAIIGRLSSDIAENVLINQSDTTTNLNR